MADLSVELMALMGTAAGLLGTVAVRRLISKKTGSVSSTSLDDNAIPPDEARKPVIGLAVQTFDELVQSTGVQRLLDRIQSESELNSATWDGHVLPVLQHILELVQLLPASEAHHHAGPGGLIVHLCETAESATRLRRGVILPPNRQSDDVSQLKHRWTVGLIIAALLHDIGKPVSDVRVRLYGPGLDGLPWNAMAGSMLDAGASSYIVHFPTSSERDYEAHQKLGSLLMQRLVPSKTLSWLSVDRNLTDELFGYLAGEDDTGNLARLVKKAEQESVSRDLRDGPRTRFSSARAVPLIERLMSALRRMLAEGGHLPLNRPGSAGYVSDGEIWFAAARLANEVRAYLHANESSAGVPGPDKNDRFFDAWQDYGACVVNPETGKALWSAAIEFDEQVDNPGYILDALIKFPLDLVFRPENMPMQMPGRVVPFGKKTVAVQNVQPETAPEKPASAPHSGDVAVAEDQAESPSPTSEHCAPGAAADAAALESPATEPVIESAIVHAEPVLSAEAAKLEAETGGANPQETAAVHPAQDGPPARESAGLPPTIKQTEPVAGQAFLDDEDSAGSVSLDTKKARSKPEKAASISPVAPAVKLPTGKAASAAKETPALALDFMTWVQTGIADGSMKYNCSDAMVHFVRFGEETALLLVSPSIFRSYAQANDEPKDKQDDGPGRSTQRAVSRAGWHLKADSGKNIWAYQVVRKGKTGGNMLNGFLLPHPERFFDPVPPANPQLVLWSSPMPGSSKE
ncbi:MAG: MobH family relaxase [Azonexus sp.]|jgi:integrating conjugative element relaxase (TIGR03760 family)|nr:MobH family relaxase [Azonexus sp.]